MASRRTKLSYHRLTPNDLSVEDDHSSSSSIEFQDKRFVVVRLRRTVHIRRKLRVRSLALNRHLKRKAGLVKSRWTKIRERLKESKAIFGDLFAGNYLFTQVIPTPLQYDKRNDRSMSYETS